jgi:septal ring factor EnvC (AmiA/AmiB activator)
MSKHVTDSERQTIAALNRKETELKEARDTIEQYKAQLRAMKVYV